jgi:polar amino acid transport system substrate-binding protein
MSRRTSVAGLVLVALLGACAQTETGSQDGAAPRCDRAAPPLFKNGVLTVATDQPAYPPWFKGSPKHYSGYEGEIATEIAQRMDLPIKWVVEPFNKSYAPGAKDYDFDINEITITPARDKVVDFSDGYFDNNQGILALKDNPVTKVGSIADLKDYELGTQVGTTSLDFINTFIQPTTQPKVFDTTNDAKSALESGQIDALVADLVTAVYVRDFQIDGTVVLGQYPTHESFGMVFEEGNALQYCVNDILDEMGMDRTLNQLRDKWLKDYLSVPTLERS